MTSPNELPPLNKETELPQIAPRLMEKCGWLCPQLRPYEFIDGITELSMSNPQKACGVVASERLYRVT